ncbi:MAG: class I SAM-dependent methyltransferase [Armatimonadota bacterium]|nr:class I SAM-dependent methyltransferase [Armatimonadota bacterium]
MLDFLKRLPIDFGQAHLKHRTAGKRIALRHVPAASSGMRALDIGCRDGYYSEILKQRGYTVCSIDINPQYPQAEVVDANQPLPYADRTFDLIWCSEVLEHLRDPALAVAEFRRVLKPGGLLVLTTPNSGCWIYRILGLFGIPPAKAQNPDHKHFFTIADMRRLFPEARLFGYFPYILVTRTISCGLGLLTPTFVVIETRA